jgi:hypothetical protein
VREGGQRDEVKITVENAITKVSLWLLPMLSFYFFLRQGSKHIS